MTFFDTTNQGFTLTPAVGSGAAQAVSTNYIGNVYAISSGQSIAIIPEAQAPRLVWVYNVGLLPVILSTIQLSVTPATTQKIFPDGLHIPCGDFFELKTSATLYASVPIIPKFFSSTALFVPKALVSTGFEN